MVRGGGPQVGVVRGTTGGSGEGGAAESGEGGGHRWEW